MKVLTDKQERVLQTILRFLEREDRPPTTRELARLLGRHVKTVYQHLLALERKGCIERRRGRIRVAPELRHGRRIPLVGHVAAGKPILAVENIEGHLSLEAMFPPEEGLFVLTVRGDSMVGAHICDGDFVIVRQQPTVENGEIGVAIVNDEATVKRIWISDGRVRLAAENPAVPPLAFDAAGADLRIVGKVIGVIRKMS